MCRETEAKEARPGAWKGFTVIGSLQTGPQEAPVALDVRRISDREQLAHLAPALAELHNSEVGSAPHCRPVATDEIQDWARADNRFAERTILVAQRGGEVVGWSHLEPPGVARTAGDLYPYLGGEVVFQSGLPFSRAGPGDEEVIRGLLYAACQAQAQQGVPHLELLAPADCGAEAALRAEGLQPADDWATYVVPVAQGPAGSTPLTVRAASPGEVADLPELLHALDLLTGEFTDEDFRALRERFPGFRRDGLLVAQRADEVVGYAAVMLDPAYAGATGRERAWLGLGPLGIGVRGVPEQAGWLRTLANAARIVAFRQGAGELALVASLDSRERTFWEGLGFDPEVRWRRWRVDL